MAFDIDADLEFQIAHMKGVKAAIVDETEERARVADGLLVEVRATTPHNKIDDTHEHETSVSTSYGGVDGFINLNGTAHTSAKSIEFGHLPSGFFAPERYGRKTKAPEGHYILHRAAGLL